MMVLDRKQEEPEYLILVYMLTISDWIMTYCCIGPNARGTIMVDFDILTICD